MSRPIRTNVKTIIEVAQSLRTLELNRRTSPKNNLTATGPPDGTLAAGNIIIGTVGDSSDQSDGYSVLSLWIDTSTHKVYQCIDATKGAGQWVDLTAVGAIGASLAYAIINGDSGQATVLALADTLAIIGGTAISTVAANGSPDSVTVNVVPGEIDHGGLAGLSDDDHTHYLLIDGTRAMTGALDMDSNAITKMAILEGVNGKKVVVFTDAASDVNYMEFTAGATGQSPIIGSEGETNVDLTLNPKGTGIVNISSDLAIQAGSSIVSLSNSDIVLAPDGSGSVIADGRNIATDGTKLDTIETNADVTDAANVDAAGATMNTDFTAKGDLLVASAAETPVALNVGTDGQVVIAASGELTGLDWDNPGNLVLARIAGSTYKSLQHYVNQQGSSGFINGGTVSDAGGETINVTGGQGFIRSSDSHIGELLFFDWSASNGIAIPTDTARWVGVQYNPGPQIVLKTSYESFNLHSDFPIAEVVNQNTELHIQQFGHFIANAMSHTIERFHGTHPLQRDERVGGLILGETGTRNITMSAGILWDDLSRFAISAFNSSGADRFETYYLTGATWTRTADVSQWPNVQYNNTASGLVDLTSVAHHANLWFYLEPDDQLVMVYGQAQFTSVAMAEAEAPPSTIPLRLSEHATLVAQLTFGKNDATAVEISSAFRTVFSATQAADHFNLANIGSNTHAEIDSHIADTANPHSTDIENLGGGTLAELNAAISDATLVDTGDILLNADIAPAEGFVRKTGAGAYTAHKSNLAASTAPTVNEDSDDGYSVGSEWIDTTGDKIYFCLDATVGAAVWQEVGSGGGGGDVTAAASIADHAIVRGDGGGKGVQTSGCSISDAGVLKLGGSLDLGATLRDFVNDDGDILIRLIGGSSVVNYLSFIASIADNALGIIAAGASTDIDINITPKGTGGVNVSGRHTSADSATIAPLNITERSAEPSVAIPNDIYLDDGTNTVSGKPGFRRQTPSAWEDVAGLANKDRTITKILYIEGPVDGEEFPIAFIADNVTMIKVNAVTDTGTVDFNIERRNTNTPDQGGTDVLTSDLTADDSGENTTTFDNAGLVNAEEWLVYKDQINATGSPTKLWITLEYRIN